MTIDPAISLSFGLSLAALLGAAAAHKIVSFSEFVGVVRNYRIAPNGLAAVIALVVIGVESALALGLLAPAFRSAAALGAAMLFAVYAGAIGFNLSRGNNAIDCGCSFGAAADRLGPALLFRNGALVAAALLTALPTSAREIGPFGYTSAALFVLTISILYLAAESARSNADRFHAMGHAR